jgi:hypothetical protein
MPARRIPPAVWIAASFGVAILYLGALFLFQPQMKALGKPVQFALAGVVAAATIAFSLQHWRGIDEPSRAAHKWAWLKGGTLGLTMALLLSGVVVYFPALVAPIDGLETSSHGRLHATSMGFVFGVMFAALAQMAAATVAWLVWWANKRSA